MKYILEQPIEGIIGTERFKTAIRWRNGVLMTDEPEKVGGKDIGPDPYTLLLSSLVSCTLATLRMYVEHKGLHIPEIAVEANIYYETETSGTVIYIERNISMKNVLDPELQQRMIRIAESCPISKILKGNIKIITDLNSDGIEILD
jgi:putative redox protein